MSIKDMGEGLQMKDGIIRKVTPTERDADIYDIMELNPNVEDHAGQTKFYEHLEQSFLLSRKGSFSMAKARPIADLIEQITKEIEEFLGAKKEELKEKIEVLANEAHPTYKMDILDLIISGFVEGKPQGQILAERSLAKNKEDLRSNAATIPFQEDVLETEKKDSSEMSDEVDTGNFSTVNGITILETI